ncbi:hypothetical protein EMIHUDRAFT_243560 [Emiliania huxleyi CCMP1516]|uniref:Homeobox domain-containing protein n=2 Tax=Emiliania huxleyi TaxID=2903 RepID=A0A0D3J5C8_EMIH1|nr:hypothetical protein EMIHUDRAFT_243560 [Emiliania huxleyi CCMP1516]EOD18713.1 hypothetical protein EMIHUDRAFT_243560 [Emiliania huxleyi CCMP1516]|eukprot:XP_005771142.1 hypothetical protein EMIHUDRAFT_243560 [Emiliania huxleyi CCMP1516]
MKLAQHEAAAPRQRLSLSASKKRALEAAFDAESTPGLEERKRIAAAVDITPRQVQVWFQNRRQRTRGGTSRQPSPRTSKPAPPRTTAVPTRSAAVSKAAPPAEAPTSAPQVPAVSSARPSPATVESAAVPARPSRPPASSSKGPSPPVVEALMGFLCHQLELQAMDLWFCGSGHMELRQVYAPEGASVLSQLLWCRAVLSTQLLDAVSAQGRAVWFGASPEQASLLSRAGGGKAVIGVPCPESPAACAAVGPPTRPSSGGVAGVLLLYCSHALDRTPQLAHLLSAFGSAVAAATAAAPAGVVPRRGYSLHPVEAEASGPGWLLLAAALAADAEAPHE